MPFNYTPGTINSPINVGLGLVPITTDPAIYPDILQLQNAIRQLQLAVTAFFLVPSKPQVSPYTLIANDTGYGIDTNSTVSINTQANAGYTPGHTTIITNISNANISIVPLTGVTLELAGYTTPGIRTLANFGMCTLRYIGSDIWLAAGAGLS